MNKESSSQHVEVKTKRSKKSSRLSKLRKSSKMRTVVILVLMTVVVVLFFFWGKFRIALVAIFILLLVALGLETSGNDWDLGKLLKTGSFSESKIERTVDNQWLFDNCNEDSLNCASFKYQEDAQDIYDECIQGGRDVHRLDGDNDGIVCEMLPSRE